jgi:hypothetical protein
MQAAPAAFTKLRRFIEELLFDTGLTPVVNSGRSEDASSIGTDKGEQFALPFAIRFQLGTEP